MTAIRETIIAEFFTRLQGVAGVAVCRRMPSSEPSEFPALDLDDRGQQKLEQDAQQSRFALTLAVEGRVQGAGGEATHQSLITLYADTVRAILADNQLGGLVETIEEQDTSIEISALSNKATLAFTLVFEITFSNRSHDPDLA